MGMEGVTTYSKFDPSIRNPCITAMQTGNSGCIEMNFFASSQHRETLRAFLECPPPDAVKVNTAYISWLILCFLLAHSG